MRCIMKNKQYPKFLFITHLFTNERRQVLDGYQPGIKLSDHSWSKCLPLNRKARRIQSKMERLNGCETNVSNRNEKEEKSVEVRQEKIFKTSSEKNHFIEKIKSQFTKIFK